MQHGCHGACSRASLSYQDLGCRELKRCIKNEWVDLSHSVIERVVGERRQRLRACLRAGGGHFEHDAKMM